MSLFERSAVTAINHSGINVEVLTSHGKIKAKKIEEPILKLEEEEPLILEQVHEEKKAQKIEEFLLGSQIKKGFIISYV